MEKVAVIKKQWKYIWNFANNLHGVNCVESHKEEWEDSMIIECHIVHVNYHLIMTFYSIFLSKFDVMIWDWQVETKRLLCNYVSIILSKRKSILN